MHLIMTLCDLCVQNFAAFACNAFGCYVYRMFNAAPILIGGKDRESEFGKGRKSLSSIDRNANDYIPLMLSFIKTLNRVHSPGTLSTSIRPFIFSTCCLTR